MYFKNTFGAIWDCKMTFWRILNLPNLELTNRNLTKFTSLISIFYGLSIWINKNLLWYLTINACHSNALWICFSTLYVSLAHGSIAQIDVLYQASGLDGIYVSWSIAPCSASVPNALFYHCERPSGADALILAILYPRLVHQSQGLSLNNKTKKIPKLYGVHVTTWNLPIDVITTISGNI